MALIRWNPLREIERLEPFREIDRWDPFREMDNIQRQMNRVFDRLTPTNGGEGGGFNLIPAAEIEETDDALHLRLEVPGLQAKDIDVQVTPESVSISGERRSETKAERENYIRSEFRYGKFQRVIPLPCLVQNEQVQAEYKDGILRLTLPKAESERQKAIKVNIAS